MSLTTSEKRRHFSATAVTLVTLILTGCWLDVKTDEPEEVQDCDSFNSGKLEEVPVQTTAAGLPTHWDQIEWQLPSPLPVDPGFVGTPGAPASHEGIDFVAPDADEDRLNVVAAADGTVVFVRTGCPASNPLAPNELSSECGAGWGNHVVIDHGDHIFTRYAHLDGEEDIAAVGATLTAGDLLGQIGNSGRSDFQHLHFELGTREEPFEPCALSQAFDFVYDPAPLFAGEGDTP